MPDLAVRRQAADQERRDAHQQQRADHAPSCGRAGRRCGPSGTSRSGGRRTRRRRSRTRRPWRRSRCPPGRRSSGRPGRRRCRRSRSRSTPARCRSRRPAPPCPACAARCPRSAWSSSCALLAAATSCVAGRSVGSGERRSGPDHMASVCQNLPEPCHTAGHAVVRTPPSRHDHRRRAEAAGVAASTVSRAFTQPGTGQPPHPRARARGGRASSATRPTRPRRRWSPGAPTPSRCWSRTSPTPTSPASSRAPSAAAAAAGLTLVLGDTQENPANEEQLVRRLGPAVDGFVLSASRLPDDDAARGGRARTRSRWSTGPPPGSPAWWPTSTPAPEQIVDHLASLRAPVVRLRSAARRVLVRGPPLGRSAVAAAADAGWRRRGSAPTRPTLAGGPAAADAVLAAGGTAVVCHNDMLAIGVMRAPCRARRGRAATTSASWASTTSSAPTSASPPLTTLAERTERRRRTGGRGPRPPGPPARQRGRAGAGAADPAGGARLHRSRAGVTSRAGTEVTDTGRQRQSAGDERMGLRLLWW